MTNHANSDRTDRQSKLADEHDKDEIEDESRSGQTQDNEQDENTVDADEATSEINDQKPGTTDEASEWGVATGRTSKAIHHDTHETESDRSDSGSLSEDAAAAVHRSLGETGVRLNEGHAYLSTLRTASTNDSEAAIEITRAEIEALIETLLDGRDQLDTAIEQAESIAQDVGVDIESDTTGGLNDTDPSADDDDVTSKMFWNTSKALYLPVSDNSD
jgi:hypothetical protein